MKDRRPYLLPDGTSIPGHWLDRPERFVATPYGWKKLTMWAAVQLFSCDRGDRPHLGCEFHHRHGRGFGGGKRDDRLPELEWLCRKHHNETPILRRHDVESNGSARRFE
jgi:hypothetical protein